MNICEKPLSYYVEVEEFTTQQDSIYGLAIAILIISLWAGSLALLLSINYVNFPIWLMPIAIVWQMFLYTGLFITAHDAMHGSVFRRNPKINNFIGSLTVALYAFFPYQKMLKKHWLHHRHPASELDPDFHDSKQKNPISWYFRFMLEYSSWQQLILLSIVFNLAKYVLHISEINLILFWIIPPILSSIQLFYFGTYLPHRQPETGYIYPHCSQTIALPSFWSFIACYHFGYHEEHHEYPHVSWWQLPSVYRQRIFKN
ncbi:fatty acid desaturase [Tolypothrix tenuis PCC 7101]|uniref:Fatty acid desaturase n=1 Tax=Tolypothrix tenuis PCC 7101 TaxID=231146 RepID=A0A1Z4N0L9_9CYAN|nr:fatty acid desaturase [Aulosira sp. FACHB-113]BAY99254.1 fatty acid desaturase [Tolypothrix tenuis PCC 7101]BAZ76823.1 fatty acid desaturase [Aulosira laxa NIES-50]